LRLIGHRGGRGFGTDNTLEAMTQAAREGVREIETDIRMTADGELVICHDALVRGHAVSHVTYEELIKHAPERPLLRDILENLAGWVSFNLEVKDASMRTLAEMLESYSLDSDTLITSFSATFLEGLKALYPQVRTGHLYRLPYGQDRKLENAVEIGAQVVLPYVSSISEEMVLDAHDLGLEVVAWTVNERKDLNKLMGWGADGVITDHYLDLKSML